MFFSLSSHGRFSTLLPWYCCCFIASACSAGTEKDGFEPQEGIWLQTKASNVLEDTCSFTSESTDQADIEEEDFGMYITMSGPQRFRIYSLEENDQPSPLFFACSLENRHFSCYPLVTEQPFHEASDIILQTKQHLSGSFNSTSSASVTSIIDVTCSGDECAALEAWEVALPCSITSSFSVELSP